jgi:hypothetical protein
MIGTLNFEYLNNGYKTAIFIMLRMDPDWFVPGGVAVTSYCPLQAAFHTSWVAAFPLVVAYP